MSAKKAESARDAAAEPIFRTCDLAAVASTRVPSEECGRSSSTSDDSLDSSSASSDDLWQLWHDSRLKPPRWYDVAKDIALIQPSSAFMECVLSILRACMDERLESSFSDRIAASALLKYNRGRGK